MNMKFAAGCLVAGALLLPAVGYSADSDRSAPAAYVKDSVITVKIKADLAEEKVSSLGRISVDTDNKGQVVLNGSVANRAAADKAVAIARAVKGVTSVESHIKIVADK